jgi:hypothetical protein
MRRAVTGRYILKGVVNLVKLSGLSMATCELTSMDLSLIDVLTDNDPTRCYSVKRFLDQTKVNVRRIMDGTNAFERVGLGLGKAGQGVEVSEVIRVLEAVGSLH